MFTLYYHPGACSLAVHAVLEELALPFELRRVDLRKAEHFGKAFRSLNPAARVPVLVDGEFVLTEAPAILNYLAELRPEAGLMPESPRDRADCLRWLNYVSSRLHPAYSRAMVPQRYAPEDQAEAVRAMAERDVVECFQLLDNALAGRVYLTGEHIRLPDFLLYVLLTWEWSLSRPHVHEFARLAIYRDRIGARPSFQRARAREAQSATAA